MVTIVLGDWFRLPHLGPRVFSKITRELRLRYDSKRGFRVEPSTDIRSLVVLLKAVLNEDVEIALRCSMCGSIVECWTCVYSQICDRSSVTHGCLCNDHYQQEDLLEEYSKQFIRRFEMAER